MYAVGITDVVDIIELRGMSSPPQVLNQNYWTAPDFTVLDTVLDAIIRTECGKLGIPEHIWIIECGKFRNLHVNYLITCVSLGFSWGSWRKCWAYWLWASDLGYKAQFPSYVQQSEANFFVADCWVTKKSACKDWMHTVFLSVKCDCSNTSWSFYHCLLAKIDLIKMIHILLSVKTIIFLSYFFAVV